jgi:hypothetical protein
LDGDVDDDDDDNNNNHNNNKWWGSPLVQEQKYRGKENA